jgi:hypothetical protein
VPGTITISISRCGCAGATPGSILLDEDTLTSSPFGARYAWGIVQHEYAHQVRLPAPRRARRAGGPSGARGRGLVLRDARRRPRRPCL